MLKKTNNLFITGLLFISCCAHSQLLERSPVSPRLGEPADAGSVAQLDSTVFPSGEGLPPGSGTVEQGKSIYQEQCSGCHGPDGQGATADELAGGEGSLTDPYPDKTVGMYWPYATTLFDLIRRSMPLHNPGSLTNEQVYAVSAWVLYLNGLLTVDATLDKNTITNLTMPNRDGFFPDHPAAK